MLKSAWSSDSEDSDLHPSCVEGGQQKIQIASKKELPASCRSVSSSSATISVCSVTASSAGDVSSLGADSSNSSQYSRARVDESKMKIHKFVVPTKNKFSHPISGPSLQKKLQDALEVVERDFYFVEDQKSLETDFERCQISDSGNLANIQEKVGK